MRKTIIILLVALLSIPFGIMAQDSPQAFFVYRNDSGLNVFFYNNVDSITCSKFDTDSILHDDYVTQDVWTRDSVFRIPLAAIDSVAFKPLPTIYKEDVKVIKDDLLSYVIKVDSLRIDFSTNLPESMRPVQGDKIVADAMNKNFPYGFCGKVKKVTDYIDKITVECDSVNISDVYKQYFYTSTTLAYDHTARAKSPAKAADAYFNNTIDLPSWSGSFDKSLLGVKFSEDLEGDVSANIDYSVSPSMFIDLAFIIHPELGKSFTLTLNNTYELNVNSSINGEIELGKDFPFAKWTKPKIPLGAGFFLYFNPGFFIKASGTASFGYNYKAEVNSYFFFRYDSKYAENQQNPIFKIKSTPYEPETTQPFNGSIDLSAGLFAEAGLTFVDDIFTKLAFRAEGGVNLSFSLPLFKDAYTDEPNTDRYNDLAEREWNFSLYEANSLELEFLSFGMTHGIAVLPEIKIMSGGFVPKFSNTEYLKDKFLLRTGTDGNLMFPIKVGFKVFNSEGKPYETIWNTDKYHNPNSFSEYSAVFDLNKLLVNKKYTAYPIIEWFGQTLLAEPLTDFSLTATPVTTDVMDVGPKNAVLAGRIDGEVDMLGADSRYGFMYGKGDNPSSTGTAVNGNLGKDGTLTAGLAGLEPETKYYFCAFLLTGGEYYYGETMSFETEKETEEAVDLGLSVKWRGWNLGANSPEECGGYYSWGELEEKPEYTWSSYFDNPYSDTGDWVGCTLAADVSGTERDAATVTLGAEWRMPTKEEMQELVDKCQWEWTSSGGIGGYKVTGPSGKSIFLPAAGSIDGTDVANKGSYGGYWTGTANTSGSNSQAGNLYFFGNTLHAVQWSNRYGGRSIRPVTPY